MGGWRSFGGMSNAGGSGISRGYGSYARTNGNWRSFGNSSGRSVFASARTSGNGTGGWHSFGNMSRGGGAEISHGHGSYARTGGPWHSFGNSRNAFLGGNAASRPMAMFGGTRFGNSAFGGGRFGNSGFSGPGFSNSFVGPNFSLIPSLFSGLLQLGTPLFGGVGMLGASALSFAARSLIFGLASSAFDQGGFGGDPGFGQGGPALSFGFNAAPVVPVCVPGSAFWTPGSPWVGYCPPYPYVPYPYFPMGFER